MHPKPARERVQKRGISRQACIRECQQLQDKGCRDNRAWHVHGNVDYCKTRDARTRRDSEGEDEGEDEGQ